MSPRRKVAISEGADHSKPDKRACSSNTSAGEPKANERKQNELRLRLPSQDDLDRMMNYVERMWRRMIEIIVNAQNDLEKT